MEIYDVSSAKMSDITRLKTIGDTIDAFIGGNDIYETRNGLLFSRNMTTLFVIPKKIKGTIILPEQTKEIAYRSCIGSDVSCIIAPNVNTISGYAFENSGIKSFYGPAVKKIGNHAFNSSFIKEFDFPSVAYIGTQAFCNTELTAINIPASIRTIGAKAFMGCEMLEKVIVDDRGEALLTIQNCAFAKCKSMKSFHYKQGELLFDGGNTFAGCYWLSDVSLPEISKIPQTTFTDCDHLKEILMVSKTGSCRVVKIK